MGAIKVYKASAGSGKTFTLAVQYIKLLITNNPLEYRHTLAVTFTNKATAEMKDRILEQLYGISHGLKSSDDYVEALQKDLKENKIEMSVEDIRKKCKDALHYILHDYSRFRIETIDSFFQSVLRNLAHELGLNARLQVDLNDKQILSQAVDNMIDGIHMPTMADSEEKKEEVGEWIDSYVTDEIENAENWDVRKKIKDFSKIIFKEEYLRRDDKFRKQIDDEQKLKDYRSQLFALRNAVNRTMKEETEILCNAIDSFNHDITDVISRGSWVIKYRDNMRDGKYSDAKLTDAQSASLESAESMVKVAYKNDDNILAEVAVIAKALKKAEAERKTYITICNSIDLSLKNINPLRLLNKIEQEVTYITNDNNRFILAKTPILLYNLIKGSDAPFVFEKMGTIFHHVMIDEFQDTSRLQWENFKVLLLENQASGGSDLIVGDIKQSIYRFRNGDWSILKNIKEDLKGLDVKTKDLDTNYRSDVNIIAFNNAFFTKASKMLDPEGEGKKATVEEIYTDVNQEHPKDKAVEGYVRVMLRTEDAQKKEKGEKSEKGEKKNKKADWDTAMLDDMCEQIKTLHDAGLEYKKMAILLRSRTHVKELIGHVTSKLEGVKMITDEGFALQSSKAVNTIIAGLRVLCFGKQDQVAERYLIKQYLTAQNGKVPSIEDYSTAKAEEILPKEFTSRIYELREYPLNELCEELYRILNIHNIKGEDAYTLYFFDELANYLKNGACDIQSFLEYWESDMCTKSIPACQIDGINIVTIHKSKGLQYHTVFMPYCNQKMEEVKDGEMLWCETDKDPFCTLGAMPINGSKKKFEQSAYTESYGAEQLQRKIEEFNALYVAFTRAEHNLYVWGDGTGNTLTYGKLLKDALSKGMLPDLQSTTEPNRTTWEYGNVTIIPTKKDNGKKDKDDKKENRLSPTFKERDIQFQSFNRKMDYRQSNEASKYIREQQEASLAESQGKEVSKSSGIDYIEQGKLLHEIFSHLKVREDLNKVLKEYQDRGIIKDDTQLQSIQSLLENALENPDVQAWFSGKYTVINECEIVHIDKETGMQVTHRPDRVIKTDNEVCIVDFKFGKPRPEEYAEQVRGYMNLLNTMYQGKKITGYIWYVYQNKVEEVAVCF